jgi:hypothetical protein
MTLRQLSELRDATSHHPATDDAEAAEPRVPTVPLPAEALVMDIETGPQLGRVGGFTPLPPGARL